MWFRTLYDEYHNQDINIIGSSMGGFTAYHLANSLGICALLYNPALPTVMMNKQYLQPSYNNSSFHAICLGAQDDVIKAKTT
jgi:predicted esterase YcpF (UPF0227 family)